MAAAFASDPESSPPASSWLAVLVLAAGIVCACPCPVVCQGGDAPRQVSAAEVGLGGAHFSS
eukprot:323299-Heterocapsa_arctica.AAC.1